MIEVPATQRVDAQRLASMVADARERTYQLTDDLIDARALGPQLSIVNPPLWEVGHVGFFHDYFALRMLYGLPDYQQADAARLYDSSSVEHDDRWDLPLPDKASTYAYLSAVREAMLARLPDSGLATEAQSYVYQLTVLHEDMHTEAFTYTRQTLADPAPPLPGAVPEVPGGGALEGDVAVPGGEHRLGSDTDVAFRFDNEKPAHTVTVAPFRISRAPVTNSEYQAFVEDGGYTRREFWSDEGWQWLTASELEAPLYWQRDGQGNWCVRWFDRWIPLAPHEPVAWVNWYEAEAYCRWAGRRLPTEIEWEVAASRVPTDDGSALAPGKRLYPWGDGSFPDTQLANLDGVRLHTVAVGAFPAGDSGLGCRQMLGNVWEWTASRFDPYPGFQADLYQDYSEPWFPEGRRVLRGGSWATRARLINNNHRNFFLPDRNDVPSGFRTCAVDR
jgi:iron(II)-dependent oxidoreductase